MIKYDKTDTQCLGNAQIWGYHPIDVCIVGGVDADGNPESYIYHFDTATSSMSSFHQITIFFFSADFSLSKHIFSVIKYSFSVTISSYSTEDCSDQPIVTPGLNLNSCLNGYYYDSTLVSVGEFDYFPTTLPTYAIFTTNNCEAGKLLVLLSSFTDFK